MFDTTQLFSHQDTRAQRNKNIAISHSYLKERNALQEKSSTIILNNLGVLVP
jgi:hypothetical protein